MIASPIPPNESARLEALRSYEILDSAPEEAFDDFTRIASRFCGVPIALISLIDEKRQWFKSRIGLAATETPREMAFCAHSILGKSVMVVPDATRDVRFSGNPLVTDAPTIRFYAGAPLIDRDGFGLGTLCVIDRSPRDFSEEEAEVLELIAKRVVHQLELRQTALELASALREVEELKELLPICSHCKSIRDDDGYWSRIESYFQKESGRKFTHGICPDCVKVHYGHEYHNFDTGAMRHEAAPGSQSNDLSLPS